MTHVGSQRHKKKLLC